MNLEMTAKAATPRVNAIADHRNCPDDGRWPTSQSPPNSIVANKKIISAAWRAWMTTWNPVWTPRASNCFLHPGIVNQWAGRKELVAAATKIPASTHQERGSEDVGGQRNISSPVQASRMPWNPAHGPDTKILAMNKIVQKAPKKSPVCPSSGGSSSHLETCDSLRRCLGPV